MEELCFYLLKVMGVLLIVAVIMLRVLVLLWWRPRKIERHFSKQGIRGPPYRFFLGNAKELLSLMLKASAQPMPFSHNILPRVLSFYHHWRKIYGTTSLFSVFEYALLLSQLLLCFCVCVCLSLNSVLLSATFLVWFGPTVRLTVSDPDLIREIFTSKSEFYEKNEAHPLIKQLEGDGLLSLKGEKWAHHRKIITPTFHMENLKLLIPMAAQSVIQMLEKWVAMSDSELVIFVSRFLPTKRNMKSWKLDKEIKKSLVNLIDKRRENSCNERVGNGPKDLLGLMIQASAKESSVRMRTELNSFPSSKITVHDIAEECKSFFFAGEQTTSNLLTWTTVLLAMHPQWQVLARDEVLKVCGPRDIPSKDDIAKLKSVSSFIL
ncbi:hypothetical protein RHSIM_Rhsim01G0078700 [Rhododendron simsii]|uniref:Cytochrome P450 n=1 Tax=Rhododendron simsii TaxID=118357 RepID=A0A834HHT6_RHOSS|nr:hypothetical protein RHSIM_Rhsim01G0078700 [Rhododendron simsii]